ncbi:MAG: hypothetical protein GY897_00820 [Alteromonas sp.]|nr:hypothetical protein [Alteromonas sp.]|tara:strand:- start:38 stop:463 length:426 start_codon:yes stop_codon:yes gene_type:complete
MADLSISDNGSRLLAFDFHDYLVAKSEMKAQVISSLGLEKEIVERDTENELQAKYEGYYNARIDIKTEKEELCYLTATIYNSCIISTDKKLPRDLDLEKWGEIYSDKTVSHFSEAMASKYLKSVMRSFLSHTAFITAPIEF